MKTKGLVLEPEVSRDVEPGIVTLYDMSRFHNDGAMTNVTWVQLPSGLWVMSFNGVTSLVNCGTGNSLNLTGDMSFLFWLYLPTVADGKMVICRGLANADGYYMQIANAGANINRIFLTLNQVAAQTQQLSVDNTLTAATWMHIGITRSGINCLIYRDGMDSTGAPVAMASPVTSARNFYIGQYNTGALRVAGSLSLFNVYNYALTPGQILKRYEATRRFFS